MGCSHPLALRSRIIAAVQAGASARGAARRFAVSPSSSINLVRRWRQTGSWAPGQVGGQKKRKLAGWEDWLHAVMASEPDITLAELKKRLFSEGLEISQQAINTTLQALGYSYKKNSSGGGTRARRCGAKA
ncbi:MAG: transposase [Alphaproteobacteria bacterium]|nr:transposase [Alphaproteobacteria bacterium]